MLAFAKRMANRTLLRDRLQTPPSLIFFVTSRCNLQCAHCFNWSNLNRNRDLSIEDIRRLSLSVGNIRDLAISGGEPFLREDLAEICRLFLSKDCLNVLDIPTNGLMTETIFKTLEDILTFSSNQVICLNLSLDGMEKTHDKMRNLPGTFQKVLHTYEKAACLKARFPNFRLNVNTVVTSLNYDDVFRLIDHVGREMPAVDSHSLAFVRGDTYDKNCSFVTREKALQLYDYTARLHGNKFSTRDELCRKMLFDMRLKIMERRKQVVPCQAGRLIGVVMDDGDVRHCELLPSIGNVREGDFAEIWNSQRAKTERQKIEEGKCYCTHECFLLPSIMAYPFLYPAMFCNLIKLWTRRKFHN